MKDGAASLVPIRIFFLFFCKGGGGVRSAPPERHSFCVPPCARARFFSLFGVLLIPFLFSCISRARESHSFSPVGFFLRTGTQTHTLITTTTTTPCMHTHFPVTYYIHAHTHLRTYALSLSTNPWKAGGVGLGGVVSVHISLFLCLFISLSLSHSLFPCLFWVPSHVLAFFLLILCVNREG